MRCPTCDQLSLLLRVAENLDRNVPGLMWTINAFLISHLSVRHGVAFPDLPVRPSGAGAFEDQAPDQDASRMGQDP